MTTRLEGSTTTGSEALTPIPDVEVVAVGSTPGVPLRRIRRIAIVNRGEPAMRLIHAVRELNDDPALQLRTIALYTDADRRALFVHEADEAVPIGPAVVTAADGTRHSAYVDHGTLEVALRAARADAAWVGWGFVAEQPEFAELCERLGIVFIGPSPASMRLLGDKIAAKRIAAEAGLPVGVWSDGPVESIEAAHVHAARIGYPLMVKAAAGGGGRGIRRVDTASGLEAAFAEASAEAAAAFGEATLFMERVISAGRHVEVQIVGDGQGTTWAAGVRDCSVQRRHQKVIEESSSTALDGAADTELRDAAVRLANKVGYRGAGTVEFLVDPSTGITMFNEVNARLQVEHPVTEVTTGLDLVKLQIHLALGGALEGEPPAPRGHAIEVRLCAEDPDNGFAPAPGVVEMLRLPTGPGIRVDTGIAEGDAVATEFDSMVAKIIAWGGDRAEALSRLRRALSETAVVLRGGTTNRAFLLDLLGRREVRQGTADIDWLDRTGAQVPGSRPYADVALLLAATEIDTQQTDVARSQFYSSAARGRPVVPDVVGRVIEVRLRGRRYSMRVWQRGPHDWTVRLGDVTAGITVERIGRYERRAVCLGQSYRAVCVEQGIGLLVDVEGNSHRVDSEEVGVVHSPSPAVVAFVRVAPGDTVAEGDVLLVLEAMKMEMPLRAPYAGRVGRILVAQNVQVDAGAPLLQLEATGAASAAAGSTGDLVTLGSPAGPELDAAARCHHALGELRSLTLGYDVDDLSARAALAEYATNRPRVAFADAGLRRAEDEVMSTFADVLALSRRTPSSKDADDPVRAVQERFVAYLRRIANGAQPASFADALRRALAHHGVDGLEPTTELENALYRIVCAHRRADEQAKVVMALLDSRLECTVAGGATDDGYHALLDRLLSAARRRFPAVADMARELRHRSFDQPLMERMRQEVYDGVEVLLDEVVKAPDIGSDAHVTAVAALMDCPQPLHNLLASRMASSPPSLQATMLEVLMRRYYRGSALRSVRIVDVGAHVVAATAAWTGRGDRTRHLVSISARSSDLTHALSGLRPLLEALPQGDDALVDAYVWDDAGPAADSVAKTGLAAIVAAAMPGGVRRVVLNVTGPSAGRSTGASQHFTYRRARDGWREDRVHRGLHPAMAQRLHVGRLRNFRIERLPSVEDVYLFHGVARKNPRDERLFAMAEVRDGTAVRDATGRVVALPYLERMLLEALAGIRTWQSHRPPGARTEWNRVLLYVWPVLQLDAAEISHIVRRLAPETEGLGLEKIVVEGRLRGTGGELEDVNLVLSNPAGRGVAMLRFDAPARRALEPLDDYRQKVVAMRRRGLAYPYEIIGMLAPPPELDAGVMPSGAFVEHDLDEGGVLVPVVRPYGRNTANLVAGVISNRTAKYPEGMARVILLGDPSHSMGTVAEPECRRIMAAIDLAERMGVPLEWFTLSSGAKIAMDSGSENMDWVARVLRRIIEFTQAGGEVNLVVNGINVGAQPYWNAEATMLQHTRGILVMTPEGAMVLTGKQALDYSGSVSAEDNFGIGGYERIMGPNGQAQYWAPDLTAACQLLFRHYEHTYVAPGDRFPRRAVTADPVDRDVAGSPHPTAEGTDFTCVGDVFSAERNPGRKKPFDIRAVMRSVTDGDHTPLERWAGMRHAGIGVVWDAHLGGYPVCLIGMESRAIPRAGFVPADGPDYWAAGTLFPMASKKIARAINAASGNRPVVVLANLSGFDGSPESLRLLQLEYGAEIGRAIVNFRGPIVFCVVSRYHGGAFVVFSGALNENMEVAAVEGSYASVIGGAPAAAAVFARDVDSRTRSDVRVMEATRAAADAVDVTQRAELRQRLDSVQEAVRSERLGEVAAEFDSIHTVQRAQRVGSVHRIIAASALRPYLIDAVERGMARALEPSR